MEYEERSKVKENDTASVIFHNIGYKGTKYKDVH
jgi:hypothetical protein